VRMFSEISIPPPFPLTHSAFAPLGNQPRSLYCHFDSLSFRFRTDAVATLAHRMCSCPLRRGPIEGPSVVFELLSDLRDEGVVGVGVRKKGANREQHLSNSKGGRPLILEDVQADAAVGVDVWVVDLRCELEPRGLEGVVLREVDPQLKHAPCVGRFSRANNGGLPPIQVICSRSRRYVGDLVLLQIFEFLLNPAQRHFYSRPFALRTL